MLSYFLGVPGWTSSRWRATATSTLRPVDARTCAAARRYWAYHLVLPWIAFALLFAALYARMIRAQHARGDERGLRAHRARRRARESCRVMRKHVLPERAACRS